MHTSQASFVALAADEGRSVSVGGNHIIFKVDSDDSQGRLMMSHYTAPAGFPGPALHIHPQSDEAFYVLTGTLTVTVGGSLHTIHPGGLAFVPRGVPHTFANRSDEPVTMLIVMTPGGFEGYFQELAGLVETGKIENPDAMAALQSRYDIETVVAN
jgi:quercetin dioxygenase-like cupin family protein